MNILNHKPRIVLTTSLQLLLGLVLSSVIHAENSLRIATAANFLPTLQRLAPIFQQQYDINLEINSGSSGKFYTQITHGLPVDLFLSADSEKPTQLVRKGFSANNRTYQYAKGSLVFWGQDLTLSPTPRSLEEQLSLQLKHCQRISMANPKLAPYGLASSEVLARLEDDNLKPRYQLITGENINQSLYFKTSHNTDCAFIAQSQATHLQLKIHHAPYSLISIPDHWHTPIIQQGVILKHSKNIQHAELFMQFLQSTAIQTIIQQQGYQTMALPRLDQEAL